MQGQQLAAFVRSAGTTMMKLLQQHTHHPRAVFSTGPPLRLAGQTPGETQPFMPAPRWPWTCVPRPHGPDV